jgi:hypothetical protein
MRVCLLILVGLAGAAGGCTGLEPAALEAGTTVAQTGVTMFDKGKARTVELARFDEVVQAARLAAARLSLKQVGEHPSTDRLRMAFEDDRRGSIVVVIEARSETMTMIQADVGVFGETGIASLVVKQILTELTNKGSLPPPPKPPPGQKPEPEPAVPPPPPERKKPDVEGLPQ